jgi:DNA-binding transcriptional LysR family regulator
MKLLSPPIQAFFMTAQLGTVHAAARALHVTQTAVTQRIKMLEKRLSTSLFMRTRKGMVLTNEGEALLRYCYSFQELEGEALSNVMNSGTDSTVSVCITGPNTIMQSRIIPGCTSVMKKFPNLLMEFDINDNHDRVSSLRSGKCQLAIIEHSCLSEEMEYKKLKPEKYILVASAKWKNRSVIDIVKNERIIDFNHHDKMTHDYLKKYELIHHANKDRHFTNGTDALASLISAGVGYGVLPLEFVESYLANNQLIVLNNGKAYRYEIVLAWYPRHQQPKYFSHLISACD